ncbi:prolactin 2 [Brachyhypopomus gauderio]|uniref:prolactin 2 n=1 Tax=Brachyhypopomus gauderio TaxID=698409 RepID=UPI0040431207
MSRSQEQAILFVVLLCLDADNFVDSVPGCIHGNASSCMLSLASLFDRVIQHSVRVHSLSSELHSEFEQYYLPSRHQISRGHSKCHTSNILTPNGKDNAQRLAHKELAEVILKLLAAWRDPLHELYQTITGLEGFSSFGSSKVLEMSDMVHELRKGVERVMEKMLLLGMVSNSANSSLTPGTSLPIVASLNDYELLYCFRRDSDKVQNYLKILRCATVPEHGC